MFSALRVEKNEKNVPSEMCTSLHSDQRPHCWAAALDLLAIHRVSRLIRLQDAKADPSLCYRLHSSKSIFSLSLLESCTKCTCPTEQQEISRWCVDMHSRPLFFAYITQCIFTCKTHMQMKKNRKKVHHVCFEVCSMFMLGKANTKVLTRELNKYLHNTVRMSTVLNNFSSKMFVKGI